tara:strand:- start:64472 stop:64657 length:186 start_codon:yes stop_codon:yes gene_type:complete
MKLKLALDEKMMDIRLRDRLLADGKITKAEVDSYINGLQEEVNNFERLGGEDKSQSAPTQQ